MMGLFRLGVSVSHDPDKIILIQLFISMYININICLVHKGEVGLVKEAEAVNRNDMRSNRL